MIQIDSRTVEFTTYAEVDAKERFEEALDAGHGIQDAAFLALDHESVRPEYRRSDYKSAFVEYLSEGTVIVTRGGRVVRIPQP